MQFSRLKIEAHRLSEDESAPQPVRDLAAIVSELANDAETLERELKAAQLEIQQLKGQMRVR